MAGPELTPADLALLDGDLEMVRRHPTATLAALEAASKPIKPFLYEAIARLINALPSLVAAARERDQLRTQLEKEEADCLKLLEERDAWEARVSNIADALGDETEWSNCNDRGGNALEIAFEIVKERDQLRAEVGTLRAELDDVRRAVDAPGDNGTFEAVARLYEEATRLRDKVAELRAELELRCLESEIQEVK